MDFFIFNINDVYPAYESFKDPSLGLGYIKAYFDKYSSNRDIAIKILKRNIYKTIIKEKPELIGISSVTQDYTNAINFAKKIKESGIKSRIIIGGIHISNLPQSLDKVFDLGIIGEGEITVKEALEQIYQNGFDKNNFKRINGLVFFDDDGNLVLTQRRELLKDLDTIPFPYRKNLGIKTLVTMLTSRGCPFNCTYCSSSSFWGSQIRFNSAEYVVNEIFELATNYKAEHISIWDDLFAVNVTRLSKIVELISKEKKFRNISFGVTIRTDVINDEICKLLKQMNVKRVGFGVESGSDRVLKIIRAGNINSEINKKAIDMLQRYGFAANGGFIIGLPQENINDLSATLDFIRNSKLDSGGAGLAVPYPNTQLWDYAEKKGLVNNHMDFSRLRLICDFDNLKETDDFILLNDQVTKKQIIDIGISINKYFFRKNVFSLFNKKTLNFENICKVIKNPSAFLPFVMGCFSRFLRILFKK